MFDLLNTERKKLVRYVRSILSDTGGIDAEDLVQDVLLRLLERPGSSNAIENTTAYIYRSLRNRVIDYQRSQKPNLSADSEENTNGESLLNLLEDGKPNALELLQTAQGKTELFESLECLGEIEKRVVIAHELEGTPFRELAAAWNIPQNTLLSHKSRAMKKLKRYFLDEEGK